MTDITPLTTALEERYRIERQLGAGGMATVYLATDLKHDREVALKVLRPELGAVLGGERFLAEIKITARLDHPHVVPVYEVGEAQGRPYFSMQYVAGTTLAERLAAGPIPAREVQVSARLEPTRRAAAKISPEIGRSLAEPEPTDISRAE